MVTRWYLCPNGALRFSVNRDSLRIIMPRSFWVCTIITTISALVSAGFSVAGLLAPSGSDSFARYAASRSIALLIAVLLSLRVRSREGIGALALVMSLVQGFDGVIGMLAHDAAKTYGPFVFALANFIALMWLLRPAGKV
jgi:hypothetical protein